MNVAFCIGNGPSREKFNLELLTNKGITYGCNYLIETYPLNNTIVVDRQALISMLSQNVQSRTKLYTRRKWQNGIDADVNYLNPPMSVIKNRWDNEIHWGSGAHALNLAAEQGAELIVMLGYDLYGSKVDPACWIYQISRIFDKFPNTQFVQIQPKKWVVPFLWNNANFGVDNFTTLKNMLKDQL